MLYVGDYDDVNPQTYYYDGPGPTVDRRTQWAYMILPYIKNVDIFKCLTDFKPTPPSTSGGFTDLTVPNLSYIPNYAVMPSWNGGTVSTTAISVPADVIQLAEKQYVIGTKTLKAYAGTSGFYPDTPSEGGQYCKQTVDRVKAAIAKPSDSNFKLARVAFDRHSNVSNFIFCDGHAKSKRLEQTLGSNFMWGEYYYPYAATLVDEATCSALMPAY